MGHPPADLSALSWWHESCGDDLTPRPGAARGPPTPTSPSSEPGSPDCGPPTTCCAHDPACGSWCWSARWPASAHRDATAAGCPRSSRRRPRSWRGLQGSSRDRHGDQLLAMRASDRRGRPMSTPPRASTAICIRAGRSSSPVTEPAARGRATRSTHARAWGDTDDDLRCSARPRPRTRSPGERRARRDLHTDCARIHPGRLVRGLAQGGRAPGRHDPRADGRAAVRAESGASRTAAIRACRGDPRHRGLHPGPRRAPAGDRAGLLAHRRDRAAARRRSGTRSAWRQSERSPTTGT